MKKALKKLADQCALQILEWVEASGPFQTYQTGIVAGEPNEYYHSAPNLSSSKLKDIDRNIELYKRGSRTIKNKSVLTFGSAFHCLVLEGKREFEHRFPVLPEEFANKRTNKHKEYVRDQLKQNPLIESFISEAEFYMMKAMHNKLMANPTIKSLLKDGFAELTFRTKTDPDLGLGMQVRPDFFNPVGVAETGGDPYIVDLKTVDELSDDGSEFKKHIINYKYYLQAEYYRFVVNKLLPDNMMVENFIFIAASKTAPYLTKIYTLNNETRAFAQQQMFFLLDKLKSCIKSKKFTIPDEKIHEIELPTWFITQQQERYAI